MAFTVKPDGSIEVDSVEEAIKLSKRLQVAAAVEKRALAVPASPVVPRTRLIPAKAKGWDGFAGSLPENQRRVLAALKGTGKLALEDLQHILGMKGNQEVSGVLTGIIKNAKKRLIPPEEVFTREKIGTSVVYSPGPGLAGADGFGPSTRGELGHE